jgi:PEGA domain
MDLNSVSIPIILVSAGLIFIFVAYVPIKGHYEIIVNNSKSARNIGAILLLLGLVLYIIPNIGLNLGQSSELHYNETPTPTPTPTLTPTPIPTPTPTQSSTANISVSSTPSGAFIYLDGAPKGITTYDFTRNDLTNIEPGPHTITLKYAGYYDSQQSVNVYANDNISTGSTLTPIQSALTPTSSPSVEIKNTWIQCKAYDKDSDSYGIKIHVMLDAHNLKDESLSAAVYFYNDSGAYLPAVDQNYSSPSNRTWIWKYFTPTDQDFVEPDLQLFLPDSALYVNQTTGNTIKVQLDAYIFNNSGDSGDSILATSVMQHFYIRLNKQINP